MNKLSVISKIAGAAAAGIMLYDANTAGVKRSRKEQISSTANRLPDEYVNSMRMDTASATGNVLKKKYFQWQLGQGYNEFFAGIGGYFKGLVGNLVDNVVPAALATGALVLKKGNKACAAGLALCGVKYLLSDIMGIGKPKPLSQKM